MFNMYGGFAKLANTPVSSEQAEDDGIVHAVPKGMEKHA